MPRVEHTRCLGSTLGAEQPGTERPRLDVRIVDVTKTEPTKVFDRDGISVTALRTPHANLPTLEILDKEWCTALQERVFHRPWASRSMR